MPSPRLLLLALVGLAAAPATASGAAVTTEQLMVSPGRGAAYPMTVVVVTAAPGEQNRLTIDLDEPTVRVTDGGAPLTPGGACRPDGPGVVCDAGRRSYVEYAARVDTGDGDDVVHVGGRLVRFNGGAMVDAGPGDDTVTGGADVAIGGPGDDALSGKVVRGGPGADTLTGGTADFSDHDVPLSLTLDGQRNDGAADEHDLIGPDVRGVVGGAAGDVIVGGPGDDQLRGGEGAGDRISGGDGDDFLNAAGAGGHVVDGGPGDDRVYAYPHIRAGSRLIGGPGDDTLGSNFGDDVLIGGPGRDQMDSGAGKDRIEARDGGGDRLDCGAGSASVAIVDRGEWPNNCDRIDRPGAAAASVTLSSWQRDRWQIRVGCPPDMPRRCVVDLRIRGGRRVVHERVRISPDTERTVASRGRASLRRTGTIRLTTRDATGRVISATGPFGRLFGP